MSRRCIDADYMQLPDANYELYLKQTKVTHTSPRRSKVAKAATESYLPFPELHGELRNTIYTYCLISDNGKIDIRRVTEDDTKQRSKPTRQLLIGRKKKYKDISHQLLRACKQINQEATPLLYSENVFRFYNIQDLSSFFGRHATRVADIRNISISNGLLLDGSRDTLLSIETAFNLLAFAKNLNSMKLNLYWSRNQDIGLATPDFYHVVRNWMDAVAIRKKDEVAAVERYLHIYQTAMTCFSLPNRFNFRSTRSAHGSKTY